MASSFYQKIVQVNIEKTNNEALKLVQSHYCRNENLRFPFSCFTALNSNVSHGKVFPLFTQNASNKKGVQHNEEDQQKQIIPS